MVEDLAKLGGNYKTILIASLISDDLDVTEEGLVDLSHYNKPFKAPGFVKKAIHGRILDVNEAVHNFLEEVKGNPNHKCRLFTERVTACQGEQLRREVQEHFQTRPARAPDQTQFIGFSLLHDIIDSFYDAIANLNLSGVQNGFCRNFSLAGDFAMLLA